MALPRTRDKGATATRSQVLIVPTKDVKLIGLVSLHPKMAKRAVQGIPLNRVQESPLAKAADPVKAPIHDSHEHARQHALHHHPLALLDMVDFLRSALNIDPGLPVRCTIEEACFRLGNTGRIDRCAMLFTRAQMCVDTVRAVEAAKAAKAANAAKVPARRKAAPKRKPTPLKPRTRPQRTQSDLPKLVQRRSILQRLLR